MTREEKLEKALKECLWIMSYYHKADLPENKNDLGVCECPECCGHCIAVKNAYSVLEK